MLAVALAILAPLALDVPSCPRGFVQQDGACVAVVIPQHAELDLNGDDFVCHRGFRRHESECVTFTIPEGAELDASGHDFRCRRGYERVDERCLRLDLPANGKLDEQGNDWGCRRGFERREHGCAAVRVPEHAVLDASGNGWTCLRGYREQAGSCIRVEPPLYAVLDDAGHDWVCKEDFKVVADRCTPYTPEEQRAREAAAEAERLRVASEVAATIATSADATASELLPPVGYEVQGYCGGRYVTGEMYIVEGSGELEGTLYSEEGGVMLVRGMQRPPDDVTITGVDEAGNACMF